MVVEAVDGDGPLLVRSEGGEDLVGIVDGIVAVPRTGRVARDPLEDHLDPHRALAAALDDGIRGLEEDREIGLEQVGVGLGEQLQPVVDGVDLLGLVEEEGDVPARLGEKRRLELDGDPALHVDGAAPPEDLDPATLLAPGRQVGRIGRQRHGVEVPGEDDPFPAAEVGPGDDGVPTTGHLEMLERGERGLDGVGDRALVVADRLDVAQLLGEGDDICGEIQARHGPNPSPALPFPLAAPVLPFATPPLRHELLQAVLRDACSSSKGG